MKPSTEKVADHSPVPTMLYGAKRLYLIRDEPAMNGASARTSPTKRPIRMVLPPWRWKKPSTCSSRASVIFTLGPCVRMKLRPSRRPMKKLVVSPRKAHAQTIPMRIVSEISPWPAITPPTITTVSPGATRPTNAPVSRKASSPTSR